MEEINILELAKFLVKAKTNTYAKEGENNEIKLEDGSNNFTFRKGNLTYKDKYFGFNPFSGQEVVLKDSKPIWSMNYYGKIISNIVNQKKIYEFLMKAMMLVKEDRPFRGPNEFKEENFIYKDKSEGDINYFSGAERILYKGKEVYVLLYHGGVILKN